MYWPPWMPNLPLARASPPCPLRLQRADQPQVCRPHAVPSQVRGASPRRPLRRKGMKKARPDKRLLCQGRACSPRCHLVSRPCRALCEIPSYLRQLTYAPTSHDTGRPGCPATVHRALRGPFGNLRPTRFPAPRALCACTAALTSTSTVWFKLAGIIPPPAALCQTGKPWRNP